MRECGYRAIRAWGGLASEDYQELLQTLIGKCGFMLADLTTLNQNVLLEAGLGLGRDDMTVFLVVDKTQKEIPSNLGHLAIFRYERNGTDWPAASMRLLTLQITLAQFALATTPRARRGDAVPRASEIEAELDKRAR